MIPKIIHRIWLGKTGTQVFPEKYDYYRDRLYSLHPEFEIINWNNDSIEELFKEEQFKKYYNFWKNLPIHIQKCDFVRYLILYKYGGVYIDLDFEVYKNISDLLDRELLLVLQPEVFIKFSNTYLVFNGFMGCIRNHKLFLDFAEYISNINHIKFKFDVLSTTGPKALTKFMMINNYYHTVKYVDSCDILPINLSMKGKIKINKNCLSRMDTSKAKPGYNIDDPNAYEDGYHTVLGNYMDTKWVEGSNWNFELYTQPYIIILAIIIIILCIIVVYWLYGKYKSGSLTN